VKGGEGGGGGRRLGRIGHGSSVSVRADGIAYGRWRDKGEGMGERKGEGEVERLCTVAPGLYEDSCALLIRPDFVMPPAGKGKGVRCCTRPLRRQLCPVGHNRFRYASGGQGAIERWPLASPRSKGLRPLDPRRFLHRILAPGSFPAALTRLGRSARRNANVHMSLAVLAKVRGVPLPLRGLRCTRNAGASVVAKPPAAISGCGRNPRGCRALSGEFGALQDAQVRLI